MQSRKNRNLEIERQKKQKQRIFTIVLSVLVAAAALAVCYGIWDTINRRTIMTFEGNRIATSDFRFMNVLQASPEMAKEDLIQTLTILHHADMHGITVSSDTQAELMAQAAEFRAQNQHMIPGGLGFISNERIAELFSAGDLAQQLLEVVELDYAVDDDEIAQMFADFVDENREMLEDVHVQFAASTDMQAMTQGLARLEDDGDFDAFVREYSMFYPEEGIEPFLIWELSEEHHHLWGDIESWELFNEEVMSLPAGEFSGIVPSDGFFYVFNVTSRELNYEELEENFRAQELENARNAAIIELFDLWAAQAEYTVNMRAFNRF